MGCHCFYCFMRIDGYYTIHDNLTNQTCQRYMIIINTFFWLIKLKIPNNFVVQYLRTILFCINNVKASCVFTWIINSTNNIMMILLVDNTYHSYNYQDPSPVKKHINSKLLLKVIEHRAIVFVDSFRCSRCQNVRLSASGTKWWIFLS